MAFVLLAYAEDDVTAEMLDRLNTTKQAFAVGFENATLGMATMDTSEPVAIQYVDVGMDAVDMDAVTSEFFETHGDDYDFISIYTMFALSENRIYHTNVRNHVHGIGLDVGEVAAYSSTDRLLGVNVMADIIFSTSSPEDAEVYGVNGLLHETGHQWCCYVGDNFARGADGALLEIIQQGIHFYRGVQSPYSGTTPMNSDHWISNGDDTYQRVTDEVQRSPYHPFQLYFMGLLDPSEYDVAHTVYDTGIVGDDFDPTAAVHYGEVTVNDIIAVAGPRSTE